MNKRGTSRGTQRAPASLIPLDTPPMEARLVADLPADPGWQFEPKWDGFRCLAFRDGDDVRLQAKSGKPLARYFPEIVEAFRSLPRKRFVLDGELAIPAGDALAFDALQMRLHPAASRIRKLAAETPAIFIAFDILLAPDGSRLVDRPVRVRRTALEQFIRSLDDQTLLRLSPYTTDRRVARSWLARAGGAIDGVVAKELDSPYRPGERSMLKVKKLRTADCVVGGFRYAKDSQYVGSLLLGLYDEGGKLDHVGFTATIADAERPPLTRKLERLIAPPGFSGDAPGGPSRWSTQRSGEWQPLQPKLVVEVQYDQVSGNRFRHGTRLLRWRPDKVPRQCTVDQIVRPARPSRLMRDVIRA